MCYLSKKTTDRTGEHVMSFSSGQKTIGGYDGPLSIQKFLTACEKWIHWALLWACKEGSWWEGKIGETANLQQKLSSNSFLQHQEEYACMLHL